MGVSCQVDKGTNQTRMCIVLTNCESVVANKPNVSANFNANVTANVTANGNA